MVYILGKLIEKIHDILIIIVLIGWLILPKKYLFYYLFISPIIFIHWKMNNNKCILSEWMYKLLDKENKSHETSYSVIFMSKLGIKLSEDNTEFVSRFGLSLTWVLAFLRYNDIIKI